MLVLLSGYEASANALPDELFLKKINSGDDVTSCSISEDGSFFVFSMSDKSGCSSLYFTQNKNGKWDDPKPLTDLNSGFDEVSPSISHDGRLIFFSSNRPGSLKSRVDNRQSYDIYYSERKGNGWSKPAPLYGAVNTAYDELYPFISRDGRTLYFSRQIDENDDLKTVIVRAKKIDDTWGNLQTVEISKNFNADVSVYREAMYRPGAYVIARKKDNPDYRGVFFADDTLTPLYETGAADADEIFVAELNKDEIIVSSNLSGNYKFYVRNVDFAISMSYANKMSSSKKFVPKPVFFDFNSTDIDMADIPYMHQLLDFLRDNEKLKLELNGYSDGIGSHKSNIDISIKRAEKVKEFLVRFGIKQNRIKTKGFGYKKNSAYGTLQSNRRVDIIVK